MVSVKKHQRSIKLPKQDVVNLIAMRYYFEAKNKGKSHKEAEKSAMKKVREYLKR